MVAAKSKFRDDANDLMRNAQFCIIRLDSKAEAREDIFDTLDKQIVTGRRTAGNTGYLVRKETGKRHGRGRFHDMIITASYVSNKRSSNSSEDMMIRLSRRTTLLAGSAWALAGFGARNVGAQSIARLSLPIPPELKADAAGSIELDARTDTMRFLGGRETATYGINGPYLGPALRLRRGETVTVQVTNNVPENIGTG
jgi:hypothetical protein